MQKMKRRKVVLEKLEALLEKYGRRIQRISEEAYKLRVTIEQLKAIPVQQPLTKEAREAAEKIAIEQPAVVVDPAVGEDKTVVTTVQEVGDGTQIIVKQEEIHGV